MRSSAWPTLFCHSLEADAEGMSGQLPPAHARPEARGGQALQGNELQVVAAGDSYNDTAMLGEAHAGILFHPPENVIREFPQYPVTLNYDELRARNRQGFRPRRLK
jgi:phosphoserine/homoserine phosphotransferase